MDMEVSAWAGASEAWEEAWILAVVLLLEADMEVDMGDMADMEVMADMGATEAGKRV